MYFLVLKPWNFSIQLLWCISVLCGINTRSSACEPGHCWPECCTNNKDRVFSLSVVQEAIGVYDKNEPKKHHGKVNDTLRLYWATQQTMVSSCCRQTVTKCQRHDTQHWTTTVFLSLWDSQVYAIELLSQPAPSV